MIRCLVFATIFSAVSAWTTGSIVSSFGGTVLLQREANTLNDALTMKKGKSNVPIQMRGQYEKQKELSAQREQMMSMSKPGDDGLPVFNLFVRTEKANVWYPCGSFKGDDRSAALTKSWAEGGLLAGVSKKQLDSGIAGSLYRDQAKMAESVCRAYPQLRKSRDAFQYGYRLGFKGLPEDKAKDIIPVEPKETKGFLDGVKNIFS